MTCALCPSKKTARVQIMYSTHEVSTDEERDFIRWWNHLSTYEKITIGTPLPIPSGKEMVQRQKMVHAELRLCKGCLETLIASEAAA